MIKQSLFTVGTKRHTQTHSVGETCSYYLAKPMLTHLPLLMKSYMSIA